MPHSVATDIPSNLPNLKVLVEGDEGWEKAISRWTSQVKVPAAVLLPSTEKEVIDAVTWATQAKRQFVVRGGGHSNGFSTISSPGVIIDMSDMRNVQVDTERNCLTVQGGANMGDAIRAAEGAGLAIATGTCNEVGMIGAALGGGIGRFLGIVGYTADTMVSARVVVVGANGQARAVDASEESNPGLFWALRGSGHLFGVVVSATFRGLPWQHDTWHSCLVIEPKNLSLVAEALDTLKCEDGMQGRLVFAAPNGQAVILLQLWFVGPPADVIGRFDTLLKLPTIITHPLNYIGKLVPYGQLNASSDRICSYQGRKNLTGFATDVLSTQSCTRALEKYSEFVSAHPQAAKTHVLIEFYGMDRAQKNDAESQKTSMSQEMRDKAKYWVMPLAWYDDASLDGPSAEFGMAIRDAFSSQKNERHASKVPYVNMAFEDAGYLTHFGEGKRLAKLRRLKQEWDPLGVIRGIVPLTLEREKTA